MQWLFIDQLIKYLIYGFQIKLPNDTKLNLQVRKMKIDCSIIGQKHSWQVRFAHAHPKYIQHGHCKYTKLFDNLTSSGIL